MKFEGNRKLDSNRLKERTMRIGTFAFEDYCETVKRFHGSTSPGVIIGGFMVDLARRNLPADVLFEALCETRVCLPDAIQLLTPCTTGNGRLKIVHVGRFALTLYDKYSGEGIRAFLDAEKLETRPEIKSWFLKLKPKAEQSIERLLTEIREAGPDIAGIQRVDVNADLLQKKKLGSVRLCPACGEAYPVLEGEICGGCRRELPYLESQAVRKDDHVRSR